MQLYTFIDILLTLASLAALGIGIAYKILALIIIGPISYLIYPALMELALNTLSILTFNEARYQQVIEKKIKQFAQLKYPIIYHPRYNITACGIEKIHHFDSRKYGRAFDFLLKSNVLSKDTKIHKPAHIIRALLFKGHSKMYLLKLCYSLIISRIVEIPLVFLPASLLRWRLLEPMGLATQGTIDGGMMALEKSWAINLSGGYHHASYHGGGGFCVYTDISMCINHLRKYFGERVKKAMIIDLDAHQGNGHERDFLGDPNVMIVDAYNHSIYPADKEAKRAIGVDIRVYKGDSDDDYLGKLEKNITPAIANFQPDFILYNAGTDCLQGDPLGDLNVTADGIIRRDEFVFSLAFENKIPILMVLSGGYQKSNAQVIADSIANLGKKFKLFSQDNMV